MNLADAADALRFRDQQVLAGRFCREHSASWRAWRGAVVWGPDNLSYSVEAPLESIARWIGFEVADELAEEADEQPKVEAVHWGTRMTSRGTYAAQFTLEAA